MNVGSRVTAALALVTLIGIATAAPAGRPAVHDWEQATPASVGLDGETLAALTRDIRAGKYSNIHSLLIVRHGKLALEEYFAGNDDRRGTPLGLVHFDAGVLHDVRSVSKSVTAALLGIALAAGRGLGVDTSTLDFFPEYKDLATPERRAIRLVDVLSMSAGLAWDEDTYRYGDPRNSESAMDQAPDHLRYVLQQPVVAKPGEQFRYSGGNAQVLAAVVQRLTRTPVDQYAQKMLFQPLGITRYEWLKYPDGTPIAASGLRLLPRDMAKFGQLYLQNGRWYGEQIVPADWVRESLAPHAVVSDRQFGFQRYGLQWWLGTAHAGAAGLPWQCAVGYGGQRIMLIPSLDLVMVITAGLYGDPHQTDITFEILLDRILPAVRDS